MDRDIFIESILGTSTERAEFREYAKRIYMLYEAYIAVGFAAGEALELVKLNVQLASAK